MNEVLLYIGASLAIVWGVAHLMVTKSVVDGFGEISRDNRFIITQEWIAEGITICPFLLTGVAVLFLLGSFI